MRIVLRAIVIAWHIITAALRMGIRLALRREGRASATGRTLAELFEALGPSYVKLGQLLSTRRDLLSEEAIRHLARLRDRLPAGPFRAVPALFRDELHREIEDVFQELDPHPVASASIASVYRGRLRDGRVVAVKVRHPGIARRMAADLRILKIGARVLARLPPLRRIPVEASVADFCGCLERQLDFRAEAAASRRLRAGLAGERAIVVPELVDELCGPSILTMEFIEGLESPPERGSRDARVAVGAAVRALYQMIFVEGCVHCDLHRGNLGILQGGRAALLDFGFVAELDDRTRLSFADFFFAMGANDGARCASITRDMALFVPHDLAYREFEAEVAALVDEVSRASARDFRVADFVARLFDVQRRHRLHGTSAFVMPILSLLVLEGIVKDEYPDLDFQNEARPYVLRAIIFRSAPERLRPRPPALNAV
ncbi:MAG TPA: AarF/UbiB family protein [Longimicrobium sp.]|jgi:ubiquinone biosynthesis protein